MPLLIASVTLHRQMRSICDGCSSTFDSVPVTAVGRPVMPGLHAAEAGPEPPVVPGGEVVAAGLFAEFVVDDGGRPGVVQAGEVFDDAGMRGPAF